MVATDKSERTAGAQPAETAEIQHARRGAIVKHPCRPCTQKVFQKRWGRGTHGVREVQARIMQWLAKVQEEEYRQGQTCDPTVHMQSV
jgi:hypothetical protein